MTRFTKDTAMKLIKIFLAEAAFLGIATMLERYGGDLEEIINYKQTLSVAHLNVIRFND